MSIGDHVEELRHRLILAIIPPLPLAVIFFLFADPIVKWFIAPLHDVLSKRGLPTQVQVLSPPEFLVAEMKIAFGAAILVSCPWILYQLWKFISPGLHHYERRFVYFLIPGSIILGLAGLALMYYVMLPVILEFMVSLASSVTVAEPMLAAGSNDMLGSIPLLEQSPEAANPGQAWIAMPEGVLEVAVPATESGFVDVLRLPMDRGALVSQQFQLSSYLSFVLLLMMAIALSFQMPLVLLLLGWMGIVTPQWLRKNRRYALLVLAVASAFITPQDAVSMLLMLLPLYLLYELGIAMVAWIPASRVAGPREDDP
ncbi:MAG: twin-arginine translocase subunit TatC [Phycisphaerales bacterium]|jgi:sec-independent protein translocase protein TatC|nr:twin-arginine translocase subunit TatC [Phycisphaerales bacterium]